jgi:hypothetical protein
MCHRFLLFAAFVIAIGPRGLRADGFSLEWALAHDPYVTLKLTEEQRASVGRERKLVLNEAQRTMLAKHARKVPRVLGVESPGEPDCSCHIASAMWTATSEVTIWTRRLSWDKEGSRIYYECRQKPGNYTMDADGQIYAAGQPIPWEAFRSAVFAAKEGEVQLALPPSLPQSLEDRIERLKKRKNFFYRL